VEECNLVAELVDRPILLESKRQDDIVGGAQHALGFTVLRRGVWEGHSELHVVCKEELPQGGVIELVAIVTLDTLDIAIKPSTEKREELGDTQKGVRLQTQRKIHK
jgi:hypothetical protein